MTIDPAFLEGDPVGTQIAFLNNVNAESVALGNADGGAVERSAITEQDYVADCAVNDEPIEKLRPFLGTAAKVFCSRQSPECPVAAVEIDAIDGVATLRERVSEAPEKSCRHTLQEEKRSPCIGRLLAQIWSIEIFSEVA
jgi:hypothetical protein